MSGDTESWWVFVGFGPKAVGGGQGFSVGDSRRRIWGADVLWRG